MPLPSLVARNILQAIRERDMTPAEFARKTRIHESYFSRLKNGTIREPARDRLQEIADALGTTSDALLGVSPSRAADPGLADAVNAALGSSKAHLVEAAIEALRELPPNERDQAIDVLHVIATNWPRRR